MTEADHKRVLVVIPARYGSSRFPGKALADLAGKPLVVRVVENAARMTTADRVVVATDDERIALAVRDAGYEAELTGSHATGTDRIGEVAARDPADIVVNLQGDEPLLDPALADGLVAALRGRPRGRCRHLRPSLRRRGRLARSQRGQGAVRPHGPGFVLFARAHSRYLPGAGRRAHALALRHVGIYAFRRAVLERFLGLARTPLEQAEGLEQLRALEHGVPILVQGIAAAPVGVDTPADLDEVRRLWRTRG